MPDLNTDTPPRWHALTPEQAAEQLDASIAGYSSEKAAERLASGGPNVLEAEKGVSLPALVLSQVANPMVYLLVGAGAVSLLVGKLFDAGVILVIVIANVIIGVVQEYRAEASLDALRKLSSPRARVIRDGEVRVIEAAQVVTGDVLVLETGDRVAADARLISDSDLRVDESALTGESDPVDKSVEPLDPDTGLADRVNMVFSSTPVVAGRGTALVTATGMRTVIGEIAGEDVVPGVAAVVVDVFPGRTELIAAVAIHRGRCGVLEPGQLFARRALLALPTVLLRRLTRVRTRRVVAVQRHVAGAPGRHEDRDDHRGDLDAYSSRHCHISTAHDFWPSYARYIRI